MHMRYLEESVNRVVGTLRERGWDISYSRTATYGPIAQRRARTSIVFKDATTSTSVEVHDTASRYVTTWRWTVWISRPLSSNDMRARPGITIPATSSGSGSCCPIYWKRALPGLTANTMSQEIRFENSMKYVFANGPGP